MKTITFIRLISALLLIGLVVLMCTLKPQQKEPEKYNLTSEKDSIIKQLGYKLDSTLKLKNKVVTRWRKLTDTLTLESTDTFTIFVVRTCDSVIKVQDSVISLQQIKLAEYDTLTGILKSQLIEKSDSLLIVKSELKEEVKSKKRWRLIAVVLIADKAREIIQLIIQK